MTAKYFARFITSKYELIRVIGLWVSLFLRALFNSRYIICSETGLSPLFYDDNWSHPRRAGFPNDARLLQRFQLLLHEVFMCVRMASWRNSNLFMLYSVDGELDQICLLWKSGSIKRARTIDVYFFLNSCGSADSDSSISIHSRVYPIP